MAATEGATLGQAETPLGSSKIANYFISHYRVNGLKVILL